MGIYGYMFHCCPIDSLLFLRGLSTTQQLFFKKQFSSSDHIFLHWSLKELHYNFIFRSCYKHCICILSLLKSSTLWSLPDAMIQAKGCLHCSKELLWSPFLLRSPLKPDSLLSLLVLSWSSDSKCGVHCLWNPTEARQTLYFCLCHRGSKMRQSNFYCHTVHV